MPNQRATGKSLVGCHVDDRFLREIDKARGTKSRSDFFREALFKYLGPDSGLPQSITAAPDRAGKGGRPRKVIELPEVEQSKVAEDAQAEPITKTFPKITYPKGKRGK